MEDITNQIADMLSNHVKEQLEDLPKGSFTVEEGDNPLEIKVVINMEELNE